MIEEEDGEQTRDGQDESGTEKTGRAGRTGHAGGTGGVAGGIRLPASKAVEVGNARVYLDAKAVVARLAEFFSELPARASAHLEVSWANLAAQGYMIVTDLLKLGQRIYELRMNPTRENRERLHHEFGILIAG